MPRVVIDLPSTVKEEEIKAISDALTQPTPAMWEIFKHNLNAFRNFLKEACKAFWWKIVDWVQNLWDSWF